MAEVQVRNSCQTI